MNMKNILDLMNPEKSRRKRENSYLNKATSMEDLERRMERIDRGMF